jgi:cold shock CspA family protein
MATRNQGIVTTWKDEQGFGFITPNNKMEKVFLHISALKNSCRPAEGDLVVYELKIDNQKRVRAENVRFIDKKIPSVNTSDSNAVISTVFALLFCLFLVFVVFSKLLPFLVLVFYAVASFITFVAYLLHGKIIGEPKKAHYIYFH